MAVKKDKVNWTYEGEEIIDVSQTPQGALAFIYRITLEDGRYYIGRKAIWKPKYTSGKNKGISKGEYPWKTYTGSSKELNAEIKKGIKYKKEILKFCFSKAETTFEETAAILCGGALKDPRSFNGWIKATIYKKFLLK